MMSYTVVFDQAAQDRAISDAINKAVRHCRIGKIQLKKPVHLTPPFDRLPPYKWPKELQPYQPVIPAMPYVGDFPHYPPATPSIWTPNTAHPIAWWQNPVCSTC